MRSRFALALALVTSTPGCLVYRMPEVRSATYEWETYSDRSTTTPIPLAPPAASFQRRADFQVREGVATIGPVLDAPAHGTTGMLPFRTDGAIGIIASRYFAFRLLGNAGYGTPSLAGGAAPSTRFSSAPTMTGGLGAVIGWWGDRDWSIALEADVSLVFLPSVDRFATVRGHCLVVDGDTRAPTGCTGGTPTGGFADFDRVNAMPTFGSTIGAAGYVLPMLRIGGDVGMQGWIARDEHDRVFWRPAGVARVFVEVHFDDVWIAVEAQQAISSAAAMWPVIGITIGGAVGDTRRPAATNGNW